MKKKLEEEKETKRVESKIMKNLAEGNPLIPSPTKGAQTPSDRTEWSEPQHMGERKPRQELKIATHVIELSIHPKVIIFQF